MDQMVRYVVIILCLVVALVVQSQGVSDRWVEPFAALRSAEIATVTILRESSDSVAPEPLTGSALAVIISQVAELRAPDRFQLSSEVTSPTELGLSPPEWRYEFRSATESLILGFDIGGLHPTLGYRYLRLSPGGQILLVPEPPGGWGAPVTQQRASSAPESREPATAELMQ